MSNTKTKIKIIPYIIHSFTILSLVGIFFTVNNLKQENLHLKKIIVKHKEYIIESKEEKTNFAIRKNDEINKLKSEKEKYKNISLEYNDLLHDMQNNIEKTSIGEHDLYLITNHYKPLTPANYNIRIVKQKGYSCFRHSINNYARINGIEFTNPQTESEYNSINKTGIGSLKILNYLKGLGFNNFKIIVNNRLKLQYELSKHKAVILTYMLKDYNIYNRHAVVAYSFDDDGVYIFDSLTGKRGYITFKSLDKKRFVVYY